MNRQTLMFLLVVVMGCLLLGVLCRQPSAGQAPTAPAGKVGKYQVSVCSMGQGNLTSRMAVLCDTETGQLWQVLLPPPPGPSQVWQRVIAPVKGAKE